MARQPITYEWQIVDDADWFTLPVAEQLPVGTQQHAAKVAAGPRPALWWVAKIWRSVTLACIGLSMATSVALSPDQLNYTSEAAAVLATLYLEEQARQTENRQQLDSLIDARVHRVWQQAWRTPLRTTGSDPEAGLAVLSIQAFDGAASNAEGNLVVVQTLVTQATYESWRSVPYREQRFYRQHGDGWIRTTPHPDDWGKQLTLETPHLRFEFYERDAPGVMPIIAQIEQLYLALHLLLQLEAPSTTNKITFAVVPEPVYGQGSFASRHQFTSPILDRVPKDLTDADYLAHLIIGRLSNRAIDAVIGESAGYHTNGYATYGYEWRNIRRALSGWLRTELLAQRSPWHRQAEALFRDGLETQLPLQLTRSIARSTGDALNSDESMWQYMLAESVVAYIAATYGHERLARFVRSLGQYDSWGRLIPEVFGVSREDFEAGWNHYLRTTYLSSSHRQRGVIAP